MIRRTLTGLAAVALGATACGSSTPDRPEVLGALADSTIIPTYERFVDDASALDDAMVSLCDAPNEARLDDAHAALATARSSWSYSEAMWVGPVMDRRSWAAIDWPVAPHEIDELIGDTTIELDEDRLSNRIGADQRGLRAVEYILGSEDDAVAVVSALDQRRCEYLTGISAVILDEATFLPADWTVAFDDGPAYRETFATTEENGLDAIVNDSLFLLEAMTDAELGVALGAMESAADIEAIEEGSAGLGAADLASHLEGLRHLYLGRDGLGGLGPLLGDDLVETLTNQFDAADAAVDQLGSPLRDEVVASPGAAGAARDALTSIQVTVSTEVVATLGVTIGFSDADGDTGG